VQIGTPREIYERPGDRFVADFVGDTNLIAGRVRAFADGRCVVCCGLGDISAQPNEGVSKDADVLISIRPEDVELSEAEPQRGNDDNVCRGTVTGRDFLGAYMDFHVTVGDVVVLAKAHPSLRTPTGDPIYLKMKAEKCVVIPVRSE